jgi:hypothetical protein
MPGENEMIDFESVEELMEVCNEGHGVVAGGRVVGLSVAAAREGEDVEMVGELRSDVVENVGGVAETGEEEECFSGAPPVEVFEGDSVGFDEEVFVW